MQQQTNKQRQRQTNKQTNLKYGEVNLQMKGACLCTQKSGSNLIEEIWCGCEQFDLSRRPFF